MIADELRPLLPTDNQTLLLRACVQRGPGAIEAWARWRRAATRDGTPPRQALAPQGAFLPLLAWNLAQNGVELDLDLATHLRAAAFTEELRLRTYSRICTSAFTILSDGHVPFIVLKGAALGATVYPSPLLRHADDIDLLLDEADLERAACLFTARGWRRSAAPPVPNALHPPPVIHPSGVPVELHRRLLFPYYTVSHDAMRQRCEPARVAGVDVGVLSRADALLHVCAHGMATVPMLRWVPDAWFLVGEGDAVDWATFTETTLSGRVALPVFVALQYLARQMNVPVPDHVLAALQAEAERTGRGGRRGGGPTRGGSVVDLWARPGPWWRRIGRVWRHAFPPPVKFAYQCDIGLAQVPYYYACRVWGHLRAVTRRQPSGVADSRWRRRAPPASH